MNWYKKYANHNVQHKTSKLIDKDPHPEKSLYIKCQRCNRYKAENITNPNEPIWKTFEEMNPQEKQEFTEAEKALKEGIQKVRISHGICPVCVELYNQEIDEYLKQS